jgi:hypothetical protein
MVFEHIEKLKRDYTDRFVVVDESRPELSRFNGQTGRVKTVNMNGKALVEFPNWANIGWYDIDVDYLKVVERPAPKEPEKKKAAPKKPAAKKGPDAKLAGGEKKLSALELARMQGAAGAAKSEPVATPKAELTPAGKMSTADILAAARGKSESAPAEAKEKPAETPAAAAPSGKPVSEMSMAEKLAAMRGEKGGSAAAVEPAPANEAPAESAAAPAESSKPISEMTMAEKLAAMRGEKSGGSAADAPAEADEPAAAPAAEAEAEAPEPETPAPAASGETVDRSTMSIDDMVAWCQAHDSES